ncbi:MAG TPA: histidine phosphatase family protein [Aliidongia sp.]|uniref:histidine phosphatase family protein n=1 Tax=Aliidongia sp. TaxID=1914230 RepID=UPI002DDCFB1D|nr:histidine phosphatase family protein [Aliidongia sp.]HEV2677718.1 histidine phosphatase family protein [Aliidongia sp.]
MTRFAVMRHAPTEWNDSRRLQGRSDPPLSAAGRTLAAQWRLPDAVAGFHWLASPLRRAIETAEVLAIRPTVEPMLIEMAWGRWEGRTLADLRAADPPGMAAAEAAGLDLQPPDGESPRAVQHRLRPLLVRLAAEGRPTGAVTHKGVLRALLALATGWDMRDKAPVTLRPATIHLFELDAAGSPHLVQANIGLDR